MTAPAANPAPPDTHRPDTRDAGRSVLAALDGDTAARPAAPETPADATAAGRSVVDALRDETPTRRDSRPRIKPARPAERTPSDRPAPAADSPTRGSAARAAKAVRVSAPAPRPTYQASKRDAPEPLTRPEPVRHGRWTEPEENLHSGEATTDVDFPVRRGVRRALSIVLLASLAATGAAAYVANEDRTPATIGIAGILGFLTLMVWAVRAGCVTTEISIRRGQLTVTRAGRTERVEIGGNHTTIAMVGEPGHRRWTVLFERPGLPLVVINSSMVDPHWFTSALYRLRPDLRPGHADRAYADA